ncbi:hypothetical protein IEQ34_000615 [Dendrobium chrysotoxum]|uniref:Uncharacterized protein n=1 Tax=Dendrobium chrysotoxum TaxID=161865 RepID=A0AAV7HQ38_DENCH|nr:hypothetical protein IEQ34_000615 [Dendrobium chrysotoxum]
MNDSKVCCIGRVLILLHFVAVGYVRNAAPEDELKDHVGLNAHLRIPAVRPPPCPPQFPSCHQASSWQQAIFYLSLLVTAIGSGWIRPCVVAFGADQLEQDRPNQRGCSESRFPPCDLPLASSSWRNLFFFQGEVFDFNKDRILKMKWSCSPLIPLNQRNPASVSPFNHHNADRVHPYCRRRHASYFIPFSTNESKASFPLTHSCLQHPDVSKLTIFDHLN